MKVYTLTITQGEMERIIQARKLCNHAIEPIEYAGACGSAGFWLHWIEQFAKEVPPVNLDK